MKIPRSVILRAEVASRTGELQYVSRLKAILRALHRAVMEDLKPSLPYIAGVRLDTTRWGMGIEDRLGGFIQQLEGHVTPAFDAMASQVSRAVATTQGEMLGGRPSPAGFNTTIGQARSENIRLMTDAADKYADDIQAVLENPETWELNIEQLQAVLQQRGEVAMSHAALIARDQVYKLNAALTKQMQENAGVTRYRWSTCRDERVRKTHRANEWRIFYWSYPPAITGHPGHDPNCRCLALPVVETQPTEAERVAELMKGLQV